MEIDPYGWPAAGTLDVRKLPTLASEPPPPLEESRERLHEHQRRLYASQRYGVLLVVQGLDAAGKDSLIRTLARAMDPAAFRAYSFGRPLGDELNHDFLWRVWPRLPARGQVVAFNRSHYEAVLAERLWPVVEVPEEPDWPGRYQAINDFEHHLHREGTRIIKVWLNTSAEEQRKRLLKRLNKPRKRWKFEPADIDNWLSRDLYLERVNETLIATHTGHAPWHLIANDDKDDARARVAHLLAETLAYLAPDYPRENIECIDRYRTLLAGPED
ncbi:polyphosphate kinase 2 family protein [Alloalcanivorax xenomutans]|uniref:Polyphosphate kinase n=1 Tax=Alloalcanivorax xenomutans TaxID=1094342 RepID=A0A9Q3W7A9_9GAMM|nr:polyphosphate kinase [Alloalcanivorax xenomutans]MCE7509348.1 polyphosphate kinase [Alloalcanivorax xenomutans]